MRAVGRWTFAGRAWRLGIAGVAFAAGFGALPAGLPAAVAAELPAGCVQNGPAVNCTYAFTGAEQLFTVPTGITSVQVSAVGAAGAPTSDGLPGGKGAQVTGTLSGLAPGEQLYVQVGGTPTSPSGNCWAEARCVGGFNGGGSSFYGGGGGGGSDVRTVPRTQVGSLDSRLIVAGGGGGGGAPGPRCHAFDGTAGGDAGAAGGTNSCPGVGTSTGGQPGTQDAGGAGGTPNGFPGTLGTGGNAGGNTGGGGGGGLYGGGGGGDQISASSGGYTAGGGGGGGSSLVPTGGTMSLSTNPASVTITYTIQQPQTITFPAVADHVYGNPDFDPRATASSGLPVTYTSTTPEACSILDGKVHILAAGTCTITASQAGNASFTPAQPVSRDITINKAPQTITFPAVADHVYGNPDFDPRASASSGLPVTYTSTTPEACSILDGKVHILAAGTCTITASQAGNASFTPAQPVSQDITINKAPIAITASVRHGLFTTTFTINVTSTITGAPVTGEPVTVNATTALFGNPVSCTATTNPAGTASCTITSLLGLRSHYTVSVDETTNYLPATATE